MATLEYQGHRLSRAIRYSGKGAFMCTNVHRRAQLVGGDRPAQVKALGLVAAFSVQQGQLLGIFHALWP
jgi:hypothetical protein